MPNKPKSITFILLGVITCGIAGQALWVLNSSSKPIRRDRTPWGQLTYDFGDAHSGAEIRHVFELTNPTDTIQRIKDIKTSCSCTTIDEYDKEISPGEIVQIPLQTILGKASDRLGSDAVVIFEDHPPLKLVIVGRCIESLPKEIDWKTLEQNQDASHQLNLIPLANETLEVQKVECDPRYFDINVAPGQHNSRSRVITLSLKQNIPPGPFELPLFIRVSGATPSEYRVIQKGKVAYPVSPDQSRIAIDLTRDGREYRLSWQANQGQSFTITSVKVSRPEILDVQNWEGTHEATAETLLTISADFTPDHIQQVQVQFDFSIDEQQFSQWIEVFLMAS